MATRAPDVLILQPYVPQYRAPLFRTLQERLVERGGSLRVAYGGAPSAQLRRRDAAGAEWAEEVPVRRATVCGFNIKYRRSSLLARNADVVVMELEASNLNAWRHVLFRDGTPTVLWGHGRSYVNPENRLGRSLEIFLAKRAAHVMTYTDDGRNAMIEMGMPSAGVTAVGNANDSRTLRTLFLKEHGHADRLRRRLGLDGRAVALYVGGLDADKRIEFLLEAAEHARRKDPSFLLVVGGSGDLESFVEAAGRRGTVRWIPRLGQNELAQYGVVAECIWMPGRIGLVAVDALALGLPVISTDFPYHAPEVAYLRPADDELFVLASIPARYAETALAVMSRNRDVTARRLRPISDLPTIESVAGNIFDVVVDVHGKANSSARQKNRRLRAGGHWPAQTSWPTRPAPE